MVLEPEGQQRQPYPGEEQQPFEAVHLRDYMAVVLKNIKIVVAFVLVAITLAILFLFSQDPEYQATAQIRVNPGVSSEKLGPAYMTISAWQNKLNTYSKMLTGPALAKKVIDRLGVDSYGALGLSEPEPGALDYVQGWIRSVIPSTAESSQEEVPETVKYRQALLERVNAELVPDTNMIELTYTCEESAKAGRVCDAIANSFIDSEHERRLESAKKTLDLLQQHQRDFENQVAQTEQELIEFREKLDFLPSEVEGEKERLSALNQTIATLTSARAEAQVRRVKLEAAYDNAQNMAEQGNPVPIQTSSSALNNKALESLRQEYHKVQRELAAARMKYGEKHSKIKELKGQLQSVEEDIQEELEHAKSALKLALEEVKNEEKQLERELENAKQRVAGINKKMAEYHVLKRKAETNRQLFDVVSEEAKKMDLVSQMEAMNIHVITSPEVKRAPLHAIRILILALMGGLAAGVGMAFFLDYMDTSITTPADLENAVGADTLGVVFSAGYQGAEKGRAILPAVDAPDSTVTENFRNLRTGVLYSPQFAGKRFIAVTSSVAQEGKTSVTTNLSVLLAQAKKKVLLIDGDIRKPSVHRLFDLDKKRGFSDFLRGELALDDVLKKTFMENLTVITCGSETSDPSELIGSASGQIQKLITRAQDEFDLVLIDTPPMTLADPYLLAKTTGAKVLLVVKSGGPGMDVVRRVIGKLRAVDADVGGTVLNQFDIRREGYYGYGYGYYDYYYHHYYYGYGDKKGKKGQKGQQGEQPPAT